MALQMGIVDRKEFLPVGMKDFHLQQVTRIYPTNTIFMLYCSI
jgi:hypothetical protein